LEGHQDEIAHLWEKEVDLIAAGSRTSNCNSHYRAEDCERQGSHDFVQQDARCGTQPFPQLEHLRVVNQKSPLPRRTCHAAARSIVSLSLVSGLKTFT
jgi:hypothetical protein